jgi:hypothetical protein
MEVYHLKVFWDDNARFLLDMGEEWIFKSIQYEPVIPTSSLADSTPRNPDCFDASSTISAAIPP